MMGKSWTAGAVLTAVCATLAAAQETTSVFSKASNDSLLWGPYRSNLYFGLRPRVPQSVSTGLLWTRVEDFTAIQNNVRFTCEQHEGMAGYGWDVFDPRAGGVQVIHDKGNGIDVETSFVKFEEGRGGWGARIRGTPRDDVPSDQGSLNPEKRMTSVWFTVGVEGLGHIEAQDAEAHEDQGYLGDVVFGGRAIDLGDFKISVTDSADNKHPTHEHESHSSKPLDRTLVDSLQVPEEAHFQGRAILFQRLKATLDGYVEEFGQENMPPPWQTYTIPQKPGAGNLHIVQKVFQGPFEFDVFYTPATATKTPNSADLTEAIESIRSSFDSKYAETFKPQAPFADPKYLPFGKSMFSNLIGGIGYFHGDQVIDRSYASEYEEESEGFWQDAQEARERNQQKLEGPYELYTAVPSRPFFPRGFLWDEGFHLLPILEWDIEVAMQIVSSWFNTMDEDGWIPREQILGNEARSKVPQEFQVQYPHYANPPTLYMVVGALLDRDDSASNGPDPSTFRAWLTQLYPLLQRNFEWYRRTQAGEIKAYDREAFSAKEGYRWRGRTPRHILTSGLDDYPRAQPPHPGELHVDLLSWMGVMTRNMQRIATALGETEDQQRYAKIAKAIAHNVDDLHWSAKDRAYCDATIDDYEESVHVCHKGYISLFPFMAGLVGPDHEHLRPVLDLIADEDELWSPFGIRSLSLKSEHYGTDENYWRSPVWMPLNWLIVKQLLAIAQEPGPQQARARTLYSGLRKNLVDNVYRSWLNTGFAWEQYNPETGEGQRTQHFTGWTSLVVQLMAMPDLSAAGHASHDEL